LSEQTTAVWSAFESRLRGFLRRRVHDADIDDVLQDIFVRIHRSLQRGDVPEDPTAWVFKIANTTTIDHYRKRGASRLDLSGADLDERPAPLPAELDELDDETRRELAPCVRPFIDALPDEQREALTWTALDGESQVEAAARAGISISGMKSRVQRGRQKLAQRFLECCELEFDARGKPIEMKQRCGGC
jgi:RNA polymerase sigma-70 factor (ECF subfamily)